MVDPQQSTALDYIRGDDNGQTSQGRECTTSQRHHEAIYIVEKDTGKGRAETTPGGLSSPYSYCNLFKKSAAVWNIHCLHHHMTTIAAYMAEHIKQKQSAAKYKQKYNAVLQ
eukprot:scaffold317343_cov31-Prasinocladus_malaysianus.AAC.6